MTSADPVPASPDSTLAADTLYSEKASSKAQTTSQDSSQYLGTVLVTGGAGIVGANVVEALIKHPACTQVIATYHSQKAHQHSCPGVDYRVCDIANPDQVRSLLNDVNPTLIIHTVSPGYLAPAEVQMKVNYMATKELVEQAMQYPTVQAFVYTSSVEATVLRSARSGKPETEEGCTVNSLSSSGAINPYGRTKGAADSLVLAANTGRSTPSPFHSGKLLTVSLRVGGLYGERDLKTIWEMLKVTNTTATRFQIGPDKVQHDWVYTANVTLAHILAAEALLSPSHHSRTHPSLKVDGEAFFITDDSPMKFWEFSRRVWKLGGDRYLNGSTNPRIIQIPFWALMGPVSAGEGIRKMAGGKGELKLSRHHLEFMKSGSRVSCDKAKARLGYKPICGTEEGVRRSVAWFLDKENEIWFKGM